jgi:tetratricopeptide (TPR) repeat protein
MFEKQKIHKLIGEDQGSPRDESRATDPRYLAAADLLRKALASREKDADLWSMLGGCLGRMHPAFPEEAIAAHERAIALEPTAHHLYNYALSLKYMGRFAEAVALNRRALKLRSGDESTLWNLGICATGARDSDAANEAWRALGFADGPLGMSQIRICETGPCSELVAGDPENIEYLWIRRITPALGEILSPTLRDFYADVGDRVVIDGAPVGYRDDGQSRVARFPVIAVLERGPLRTFRFAGTQQAKGELAGLSGILGPDTVYVHSEMVAMLCRECARAGAANHRHYEQKTDQRIVYGKLVAEQSKLAEFRATLDRALKLKPDLALYAPSLHRALDDEQRAAEDDRNWTALETN